MRRYMFGNTGDSYVASVVPNGGFVWVRPGETVRFFSDPEGTEQYTDLEDADGNPIEEWTTNNFGEWGPIWGPEGVTVLYAGQEGNTRVVGAADVGEDLSDALAAVTGLEAAIAALEAGKVDYRANASQLTPAGMASSAGTRFAVAYTSEGEPEGLVAIESSATTTPASGSVPRRTSTGDLVGPAAGPSDPQHYATKDYADGKVSKQANGADLVPVIIPTGTVSVPTYWSSDEEPAGFLPVDTSGVVGASQHRLVRRQSGGQVYGPDGGPTHARHYATKAYVDAAAPEGAAMLAGPQTFTGVHTFEPGDGPERTTRIDGWGVSVELNDAATGIFPSGLYAEKDASSNEFLDATWGGVEVADVSGSRWRTSDLLPGRLELDHEDGAAFAIEVHEDSTRTFSVRADGTVDAPNLMDEKASFVANLAAGTIPVGTVRDKVNELLNALRAAGVMEASA